jgi:ribosomal protein S18 acetylase RimI-like enzyme
MLHFRTLKDIAPDTLLEVFNASFADYIVPLQLTRDQLERKLLGDAVDPDVSAGAFEGDDMVGFILHGVNMVNGVPAVYNAGTGVKPAFRGQQATGGMYRFILPELKARGIAMALLEVIDSNIPAIKSYKAVGYTIRRELLCFKGMPQLPERKPGVVVKELQAPDWACLQTFRDWEPSWQNADTALQNMGKAHPTIGIYENERVVAYANYNPQNNRIAQIAVDRSFRGKGLATELFRYIYQAQQMPCSIINVDAGAGETIRFLKSIGLEHYITQYEMELKLD